MRGQQSDARGSLVHLARLDAHKPVLDCVDAPNAVLTRHLVQSLQQLDRRRPLAVKRHRHARLEADLDVDWRIGSVRGRLRPLPYVFRRFCPRIFQRPRLDAAAVQILVDTVGAPLRYVDRYLVLSRVIDLRLAVHLPLPQRRDDPQLRRQR